MSHQGLYSQYGYSVMQQQEDSKAVETTTQQQPRPSNWIIDPRLPTPNSDYHTGPAYYGVRPRQGQPLWANTAVMSPINPLQLPERHDSATMGATIGTHGSPQDALAARISDLPNLEAPNSYAQVPQEQVGDFLTPQSFGQHRTNSDAAPYHSPLHSVLPINLSGQYGAVRSEFDWQSGLPSPIDVANSWNDNLHLNDPNDLILDHGFPLQPSASLTIADMLNHQTHSAPPLTGLTPEPILDALPPSHALPGRTRKVSRVVESIACAERGCKRRFRPKARDSTLCRRHQMKYDRNHAEPPTFTFPAGIGDYQAAKDKIYPPQSPLCVDGERLSREACEHYANAMVQRFVEAASTPYEGGSAYHEFHTRQQKVFNGKGFKDEEVNIRLRFLYQAAVVLHTGGETVYPEGGDNGGYGRPDKTLKFLDRVNKIVEILKTDKRVCMDVIEGRGVSAFVANPDKYEKRKTQNKDSNERKQRKQQLGDKIQMKRKAKGRAVEESDVDSDEWSGGERDEDEEEGIEDGAGATSASIWQTPMSMNLDQENVLSYEAGLNTVPEMAGGPASRTRKRTQRSSKTPVADSRHTKRMKADSESFPCHGLPVSASSRTQQADQALSVAAVNNLQGVSQVAATSHDYLDDTKGFEEYGRWDGHDHRAFDFDLYDEVFKGPWV